MGKIASRQIFVLLIRKGQLSNIAPYMFWKEIRDFLLAPQPAFCMRLILDDALAE